MASEVGELGAGLRVANNPLQELAHVTQGLTGLLWLLWSSARPEPAWVLGPGQGLYSTLVQLQKPPEKLL